MCGFAGRRWKRMTRLPMITRALDGLAARLRLGIFFMIYLDTTGPIMNSISDSLGYHCTLDPRRTVCAGSLAPDVRSMIGLCWSGVKILLGKPRI
jgi:hypothetical protein